VTLRQLRGVDALHVLEETERQHMHTIKIAILGPTPTGPVATEDIRRWARERLPRVPPLRWQVHRIPFGLGRPVFTDAGPIDVDTHVRVEQLPPPGTDVELDEVVSRLASVQLDRSRPLWELTIVEGLSGDRVALVFKLHHSIMDGQASVRFLEVAFGTEEPPYPPVPTQADPTPKPSELARFALRQQARLYAKVPKVTKRSIAAIRDNINRKKAGAEPVANPMSGPSTSFNKLPERDRVYVDVTLPFADIRRLREATGATINEVFVTLCGGAIRRYLDAAGELSDDRVLNAAHPISLRTADERDDYGNRTSYWYVSLGTDRADPLARLTAVKASLDAAREWAKGDQELFAVWQDYYLLFGVMTLKTLALAERLSGRPAFNAIVSNVRGPADLSLGDAPVVAVRSMGPITRVLGLNLTAWSYGEHFSIGIQSCRAFIPDLRAFDGYIRDELDAFSKAVADR
jgi:diacylglycerol O-acyltransferase / wax synthase